MQSFLFQVKLLWMRSVWASQSLTILLSTSVKAISILFVCLSVCLSAVKKTLFSKHYANIFVHFNGIRTRRQPRFRNYLVRIFWFYWVKVLYEKLPPWLETYSLVHQFLFYFSSCRHYHEISYRFLVPKFWQQIFECCVVLQGCLAKKKVRAKCIWVDSYFNYQLWIDKDQKWLLISSSSRRPRFR